MDFYLFLGILAATIFTLLASMFYMVYGKIKVQENKIITSPPSTPSSSSSPSSSWPLSLPSSSLSSSSSPSSPWPLSLPSSSLTRSWEYDVFPSFHGPDVRKHFLSHILKEFTRKGISPFIDNEIRRGESIGPELKRAIKESKIAIVLLSKNYASSSWCLDELVEIMNLVSGQTVLTIFHEVDPTDVKKQTGDFGKVFKNTCRGKTKEKIEKWRKALEGVATIAGYHSRNWPDEAAMIENIACDISKMLNHLAPSPDGDCFIGMGKHMARMKPLLCLDLDEVRMIGIWGPPGIGKSTIARFLFHQLSNHFRLRALMGNIRGSYPSPCLDEGNAQLELQSKMLSQMLNHKDIMITHLGVAQERLKDKKVLLILDDIDRLSQLDALAKNVRWFGPGSRIIITTENLKLLKAHGINHIYKVDFPTNDEALEMFCMYAFGQKKPKDGFMEVSCETTYLAGNLPLGLKVMGSYFRGMSIQEWKRVLPNLWIELEGGIDNVLKFSYDALCDEDKNLFLHIACFFNYEHIETVVAHLANKFFDVRQRLEVLADKSLISINEYRPILPMVQMHSLLVQLGKEIVRKSDREPGQRQFLINDKDIGEVLTDPTTTITRRVTCIYSRDPHTWYNLNLNERVFEGMSNLQFLSLEADGDEYSTMKPLSGFLKYISPKLQLLRWPYSPITSLPFSVNLEFFVELYMPDSKLEKLWEGIKVLRNLKRINLSYSKNLKELPNLSSATNLQALNLSGCSSLVELPSSIGNAITLQELNLNGCSSLVELPSSIGNAVNFKDLDFSGCSSLVKLPSWIGNAINLQNLLLTDCSSLVELPSSIGNLINLQILDLSDCTSLVELPSSFGSLINLVELFLGHCSSMVELSPCVNGCSRLYQLVLNEMENLVSLPQLPDSLQILEAENCKSLEVFDCSFRNPDIIFLNFGNCFKLNENARDVIIQTSSSAFSILPGGEVPACFTYRAPGSSVTVELNEKPPRTSTKFKVCILFDETVKDETGKDFKKWYDVNCYITSKQNARTRCISNRRELYGVITKHMYIFDVEAEEVTSTELVFEFTIHTDNDDPVRFQIKECGILFMNVLTVEFG